jgi:hypothetical protein
VGAALMMAAGVVEIFLGVEAAQQNLENIATPLTAQDAEEGELVGEKLDESGEARPFAGDRGGQGGRRERDTEARTQR